MPSQVWGFVHEMYAFIIGMYHAGIHDVDLDMKVGGPGLGCTGDAPSPMLRMTPWRRARQPGSRHRMLPVCR